MKTTLFLLAACLLAAASLNAQTHEALAVENQGAEAAVIYADAGFMIDGDVLTVFVTLSEPISCEVMVKGEVRLAHPYLSVGHKNFSIRVSPGETFESRQYTVTNGTYATEMRGEDLGPYSCDEKPIVYNL